MGTPEVDLFYDVELNFDYGTYEQNGQVGKENQYKPPVPSQSSSSCLNTFNAIHVDETMVEEMEEMVCSELPSFYVNLSNLCYC